MSDEQQKQTQNQPQRQPTATQEHDAEQEEHLDVEGAGPLPEGIDAAGGTGPSQSGGRVQE